MGTKCYPKKLGFLSQLLNCKGSKKNDEIFKCLTPSSFLIFLTNWMLKKHKRPPFLRFRYIFCLKLVFFNIHHFFSTLFQYLRYIRTILIFIISEKNEHEVRKQANPFVPPRNLWVFRHFYVGCSRLWSWETIRFPRNNFSYDFCVCI